MNNIIARAAILISAIILYSASAVAQNHTINWSAFSMGFGNVESTRVQIRSVVGQQFVGTANVADFYVISGFLADPAFGGPLVSVEEGQEIPERFSLDQNYPNPFNPSTTIRFAVPNESFVTLIVYDILGREVETLVNEVVQPGYHEIVYVGSHLSSGVYLYRLVTDSYTSTKKLILNK